MFQLCSDDQHLMQACSLPLSAPTVNTQQGWQSPAQYGCRSWATSISTSKKPLRAIAAGPSWSTASRAGPWCRRSLEQQKIEQALISWILTVPERSA